MVATDTIQVDDRLAVSPRARMAWVDNKHVPLNPKEILLLIFLAEEPTRVRTKDEIKRAIWTSYVGLQTRTIDTTAHRLRRQLQEAAGADVAPWIASIWGVGYRLVKDVTPT